MDKRKHFKKFKWMCNRKEGYILSRTIISILILFFMIDLIANTYKIISKYDLDYYILQDEIATIQLSRTLLSSLDIIVDKNSLCFKLDNKDWKLELINNNLILQPGTQFFYIDIDYVEFIIESNILYVIYSRNTKEYRKSLIHV